MTACVGTLVFQCLPVNAAWDFELRLDPKTKCYSTETFTNIGLFNGGTLLTPPDKLLHETNAYPAVNIFTDFVFATLPIPIISKLQINTRTKISLIGILSLGYL